MAVTNYTVLDGEIVSQSVVGGATLDYVPDPLGSTIALLDSGNNKTDTWEYWPYGEVRARTGATATPFQFVGSLGYFRDTVLRTYVRARHYRQTLGRWMTVDPMSYSVGTDLYIYGDQAPVGRTDETGLNTAYFPTWSWSWAGAGAGGAAEAGAGAGIGAGGLVAVGVIIGVAVGAGIGAGLDYATGGGWGRAWGSLLGVDVIGREYFPADPCPATSRRGSSVYTRRYKLRWQREGRTPNYPNCKSFEGYCRGAYPGPPTRTDEWDELCRDCMAICRDKGIKGLYAAAKCLIWFYAFD